MLVEDKIRRKDMRFPNKGERGSLLIRATHSHRPIAQGHIQVIQHAIGICNRWSFAGTHELKKTVESMCQAASTRSHKLGPQSRE